MHQWTVENCYDSHVHWLATGEWNSRLTLYNLKSPDEVRFIEPQPHYFRGEWLFGWGWDQNNWEENKFPDRHVLDQRFPDFPVAFVRVDGHAVWVNTLGLKRAGLIDDAGKSKNVDPGEGGKILLDDKGVPTGVLIDLAKSIVDRVIPPQPRPQVRSYLLQGMKTFNESGFTHIRDLTCDQNQWEVACQLEDSGLLTLAVEQYFDAEDPRNFHKALELALHAKKSKTKLLRPRGIKLYYDGALGSEGALLSHPYRTGSGSGLILLKDSDLSDMMKEVAEADLDFAIHTIGDEAAHRVVSIAHGLAEKDLCPRLHLEHAEMLRPETIALMKEIPVECHLQPCHWLTDHHWLEKKIGDLVQFIFPWRALQEASIPFDFGSDSPIERPSLPNNLRAIQESSEKGVPRLLGDGIELHAHRDKEWTPNTYTIFDAGHVKKVVFAGRHLS